MNCLNNFFKRLPNRPFRKGGHVFYPFLRYGVVVGNFTAV